MADAGTGETVELTRDVLTPVVRRVLGSGSAEVADWECRPLGYRRVWASTAGVHSVRGTARDRGASRTWRLVLKVACAPADGPADQPFVSARQAGEPNYWKREAELFRDGVLDAVRGEFAAPACYGVDEPDVDTAWMWFEEVEESVGPAWPLSRFETAARHLGRFNGRYLVGEPPPAHSSFCPNYVRTNLGRMAARRTALMEPAVWEDPAVRSAFSAGVAARFAALWTAQTAFLDLLDRLPLVFCHRDAFRNNLIARRLPDGREQTVALDWALSGPGHLGEDLWKLVNVSLIFGCAPCGPRELEAAAFAGYLTGLRDAGWTGDARVARLGFAASAVQMVPPMVTALTLLRDPVAAAELVQMLGRPEEELRAAEVERAHVALELAEEARDLAPLVG